MASKKKAKKSSNEGMIKGFILTAIALLIIGEASSHAYTFISNIVNPPCANSISCVSDLSGTYDANRLGEFLGQRVVAPKIAEPEQREVLGASDGEKHIYVDLSSQRLYAYEGQDLVYEFPVSTGKWGRTPTGDFKIWVKLLYTRMEGGSGNDYYNLPNVPYTMFYYNDEVVKSRGYSIHGAYWHNNFGYPMSHGCVNMRPADAAIIYDWATPVSTGNTTYATEEDPGTIVTVYGEAAEY